jgi:hypothetical protein
MFNGEYLNKKFDYIANKSFIGSTMANPFLYGIIIMIIIYVIYKINGEMNMKTILYSAAAITLLGFVQYNILEKKFIEEHADLKTSDIINEYTSDGVTKLPIRDQTQIHDDQTKQLQELQQNQQVQQVQQVQQINGAGPFIVSAGGLANL